MHKIKLLHVLQIKPVKNVRGLSPDTALIVIAKDPVPVFERTLRPAIFSDKLPAFYSLDPQLIQNRDHKLRNVVTAKIPHIRRALHTENLRVSTQIHAVSAGIHHMGVLIQIDHIIAKS